MGKLLTDASQTQDQNAQRLIKVAQSALDRAKQTEARIKALEAKVTSQE